MKLFFICAILLWMRTGILYAQTNDSIAPRQLDEVIVKANLSRTDAGGVYFIPSSKQKNTAQNGIDLLRRMAIPQIKVSLADDNVTTNTGESISIYINYTKASAEELEGLRTSDVRKVEYYYSPSDQRFMGERNVVNIIVQPYIYGGYTKLSLGEKFFIGLSSTASVYSKFTYKKMTYDIFFGSRNFNNHHIANENKSQYLLTNVENSHPWINRLQTPENSRYEQNILPMSFRASYSQKSFQMKNTMAFTFQETPHSSAEGLLHFSPEIFMPQDYTSANSSRVRTVSYNGNFNFNLPNQYYLTITPKAIYSHNNQNYCYTSDESIINNIAKEDSYAASVMAMGRKILADIHYLFVRGFGGYSNYKVDYSGSTVSAYRIKESYGGASIQYGYYTDRITADLLLGVRGERNATNTESETEVYPFASANFGWSPNQKHSLNISLSYSKEPMNANLKSPNILQDNELMYYCGNPNLKYSPNFMANLGYNWIPNGWLQISPFTQFYGIFNRYVPIYTQYMDGSAILRQYENDGNHYRTQIGVAVTANLLNGNLQLQVMPSQFLYKSTGYYDMNYNPFALSCSAIYYLGNFYFSGFYEMKNRTLWTNSGTIYKDRSQLQFSAGWSKSDLNVRIGISNPFRTSWISATKEFATPEYKEYAISYGTTAHFNLNFSVTYTFGYGKKVSRNNEVGEQSGASSAILK